MPILSFHTSPNNVQMCNFSYHSNHFFGISTITWVSTTMIVPPHESQLQLWLRPHPWPAIRVKLSLEMIGWVVDIVDPVETRKTLEYVIIMNGILSLKRIWPLIWISKKESKLDRNLVIERSWRYYLKVLRFIIRIDKSHAHPMCLREQNNIQIQICYLIWE